MDPDDWVFRLYWFCAHHRLLHPIANFFRALQPIIMARERISSLVGKISQDPGVPGSNPTASFWQSPPHPMLSTKQSSKLPEQTDVLIIGSGITAASITHHLLSSHLDIEITIAEARSLTSGATGRNGGHILELPYESYDEQVMLLGREEAKKLIKFRLGHLGEIREFVKTEMSEKAAGESEVRTVEVVQAVFDKEQWGLTKEQLGQFLKDFPQEEGRWKVWEGDVAREKFGMQDIYGAITGPSGAMWPYRFVTSVFENLVSKYPDRLRIESHTPVLSITTTDRESDYPYISTTPRGTIHSKHIVHATNGHVSHLLPHMRGKIFPLRGQMTVQRIPSPRQPLPNRGNERSWVFKHGKGFDYMTQNAGTGDYFLGGGLFQGGNGGKDNIGNAADDEQDFLALSYLRGVLASVLGGVNGTRSTSACASNRTGHGGGGGGEEEDDGVETGGSMAESALKAAWTGTMGYSCDGFPWVGRLPVSISLRKPKVRDSGAGSAEWIAAGFCGSGMVYCWRSGRAVADMILGREQVEWFPDSLLPTEQRYRSSSADDVANYLLALMV